jgi:hypothetical protein
MKSPEFSGTDRSLTVLSDLRWVDRHIPAKYLMRHCHLSPLNGCEWMVAVLGRRDRKRFFPLPKYAELTVNLNRSRIKGNIFAFVGRLFKKRLETPTYSIMHCSRFIRWPGVQLYFEVMQLIGILWSHVEFKEKSV